MYRYSAVMVISSINTEMQTIARLLLMIGNTIKYKPIFVSKATTFRLFEKTNRLYPVMIPKNTFSNRCNITYRISMTKICFAL